MQLGIRLHDVNAGLGSEEQTMERRADKAAEEGFECVHLAFSKVIKGVTFDDAALTEGLALYTKRVFMKRELDIAVLGCYLNLAHPDRDRLREIQSRYFGHIRVAALMGAGVVGTETGAPNAEYKTDANTHTEKALDTFVRGLAPVVERAEAYGVTLAIEPVWKHIVYDARRAQKVIEAIKSPNLRIIFDPVNLLSPENEKNREAIFEDFIERLYDRIAVVHIKDYVVEGDGLKSIAAGTGVMDYTPIVRFMKQRKPYIHATLENTTNDNAVEAGHLIRRLYENV